MAACSTCGGTVVDGDNYCGSCGRPADAVGGPDHEQSEMRAREVVAVPVDDEPTSTSLGDGAGDATEVVAVTGGVDLVACPQCDSLNAEQRNRCARCGQALRDIPPAEDDYELADPTTTNGPEVVEDTPTTDRRPGRRVPTWVWIVLVGVVVGGGIGLAGAAGIGPLAPESGPAFEWDGEAYAGTPEPVDASLVSGSDVRREDGRRFSGSQLLDGDLTTAWSPTDTDGSVDIRFANPVWITGLEVANGDQHDAETFETTGRVRTLDIDLGNGQQVRATLIDGDGRQLLRLPTPALTERVVLSVEEVTAGTGVALSDVAFLGHVAHDEDAALLEGS